jgi:hypothetical protein
MILPKISVSWKVYTLFKYVCRVDDHFSNITHQYITTWTSWCRTFFQNLLLIHIFKERNAIFIAREASLVFIEVRHSILTWAIQILFVPSIPISLCTHGNIAVKCILKQMGCEAMDWIQLAQGKIQWQPLPNTVMNLTYSMMQDILWKAGSHLSCQRITCFLHRTGKFITVFKKPSNEPYPEPEETSSPHQSISPWGLSQCYLLKYAYVFPMGSYFWPPNQKPLKHHPHPCVLHVSPTSSSMI